jgi:endonuclease YncB( thermonuclease family)
MTILHQFSFFLFIALSFPISAEPVDSADIRIIDGDTIRVYHEQPNVRLVGFNAPETGRAACAAERDLGAKATRRPRDLVGADDLDFVYVTCSYPPGAQGTPTCNYGRDCGTLWYDKSFFHQDRAHVATVRFHAAQHAILKRRAHSVDCAVGAIISPGVPAGTSIPTQPSPSICG